MPHPSFGVEVHPLPVIDALLQRRNASLVNGAPSLDRDCLAGAEKRRRGRVVEAKLLCAHGPSQEVGVPPHCRREDDGREAWVVEAGRVVGNSNQGHSVAAARRRGQGKAWSDDA